MSVTRAPMDYEQAGELKIGQVGIANLRIRTLDVDQLIREMRERVERAPKLFGRAAVIVDFGGLSRLPDADTARALIDGLRGAGVIPVALAYGTSDTETLAEQLGLPLLAKFRAQYEPVGGASAPTAPAPRQAATETAPAKAAAAPAAPKTADTKPGLVQKTPVRSGQHTDLMTLPHTGFVRQSLLLRFVPFSKSTLWRRVKAGLFPAPVRISVGITAWRAEDVRHWIAEQK